MWCGYEDFLKCIVCRRGCCQKIVHEFLVNENRNERWTKNIRKWDTHFVWILNTEESSEAYMPIWLWIIVSIISKFFSIRILKTTVSEQFSLLHCLLLLLLPLQMPNGEWWMPICHSLVLSKMFVCRSLYGCSFLLYLDPESWILFVFVLAFAIVRFVNHYFIYFAHYFQL